MVVNLVLPTTKKSYTMVNLVEFSTIRQNRQFIYSNTFPINCEHAQDSSLRLPAGEAGSEGQMGKLR